MDDTEKNCLAAEKDGFFAIKVDGEGGFKFSHIRPVSMRR
jgi:hypothetical protein